MDAPPAPPTPALPAPPARRTRRRAILGVTGVFVAGLVIGAVLAVGTIERIQRRAVMEGGRDGLAELLARRLSFHLRADATQRAEIRQILRECFADLDGVRRQVDPQLRAALDRSAVRLRATLRPDQQAKFDEMVRGGRAAWDR